MSGEGFARGRPLGRVHVPAVTLAHGGGGKATKDLIDDVFVAAFDNPLLAPLDDSARLKPEAAEIAFTTDSFVVDPLVFPGGDIGKLAVCGTVNDLAVAGAVPLYLSCAVIIEEGMPLDLLRRLAGSMAATAREAGVRIVTGDTKVVGKHACDKLFITTTGIGTMRLGVALDARSVRPGDAVLVNGVLGDHGAAILAARGDLALETAVASDCAPLHELVAALLAAAPGTRFLRDPTRGGVATVLNEIAAAAAVSIELDEDRTPIRDAVRGFCEILGLDPLYLANEGKIVAIVPPRQADAALDALRAHPLGAAAAIIGRVGDGEPGRVTMRTGFGGSRIVDMLVGEQLPPYLLSRAGPLMHELSITCSIVDLVAEAAQGRGVRRVTLEIGRLSGVEAEAIAFCFPEVARGTPAETARLDISEIEGRARCESCGSEFPIADLLAICRCGSTHCRPIAGDELNLKSIELEET